MSDIDIKRYYHNQALQGAGAQPTFYRSPVFFKGHGAFGNIMTSILNQSKPLLKTAGKYLAKKGVKALGNVATDVMDGVSVKSALKRNASKAFELAKDDASAMIRKKMQYSPTKKRRKIKAGKKKPKRRSQKRRFGYL